MIFCVEAWRKFKFTLRAVGAGGAKGAGGAIRHQYNILIKSISPISNRGADDINNITMCPPPLDFQTFLRPRVTDMMIVLVITCLEPIKEGRTCW